MSSFVPTRMMFTFSDGLCSLLFWEFTVMKSLSPKSFDPLEVMLPRDSLSNSGVGFIKPLCDLVFSLFKAAPESWACAFIYAIYSIISYSKLSKLDLFVISYTATHPLALRRYDGLKLLNLSCPAVSHNYNFIIFWSILSILILKSSPTVHP